MLNEEQISKIKNLYRRKKESYSGIKFAKDDIDMHMERLKQYDIKLLKILDNNNLGDDE